MSCLIKKIKKNFLKKRQLKYIQWLYLRKENRYIIFMGFFWSPICKQLNFNWKKTCFRQINTTCFIVIFLRQSLKFFNIKYRAIYIKTKWVKIYYRDVAEMQYWRHGDHYFYKSKALTGIFRLFLTNVYNYLNENMCNNYIWAGMLSKGN